MRRVHVVVRGGVQGVGYRYTLRMIARDAGVRGWVRNRRDGSVEAELEGTPEQVDEVLAWMAQGPPGSHVESATVTDDLDMNAAHFPDPADAPNGDSGFEVRPTR